MCDQERQAHAGSYPFCLSLGQFDMKNVTVKGIICFLSLLAVSM